jgi:hypothetical protein
MAKVDNPVVEAVKATHRYVTVPDIDMFNMPHPGVRINHENYGPGTYYLDKERADTVEKCLDDYEVGNRRLLQPRQDANAIRAVEVARQRRLETFS